MSRLQLSILFVVFVLFAGCEGNLIASANLMLATVPCGLLLATLNLKKD